jgi:hypothetical protein
MTPDADDARLTEYLLGRLSEDERSLIEERFLADPGVHDQLRAVERDLIDRYVRGELPDPEVFEANYLSSPARRARVEFARSLMESPNRSPAVTFPSAPRSAAADSRFSRGLSPAWRMAAAGAIVVAGSLFAFSRWNQTPGNQSGTGDAPPAVTPAPVPSPPVPPPAPTNSGRPAPIATFVLTPNATRTTADMPTLAIETGADVRLQLELEAADYASYRVVVRTADGREIWRQDGLKATPSPSGPGLVTSVPAGRLADDDYTVRVAGITAAGDVNEVSGYTFRAQRKR